MNSELASTHPAATLAQLGIEIDDLEQHARRNRLEIGRRLLTAKALCKHGEWLPFVKARGYEPRQAQRYMQYAEQATSDNLSHLPTYAGAAAAEPSNSVPSTSAFVKNLSKHLRGTHEYATKIRTSHFREPLTETEREDLQALITLAQLAVNDLVETVWV